MELYKIAEKFVASPDFLRGVVSSTQAGFGGGGYSVELFPEGNWRVLWDNQIGNLYQSTGRIVRLPKLTGEEIDGADGDLVSAADFYVEELREEFLTVCSDK